MLVSLGVEGAPCQHSVWFSATCKITLNKGESKKYKLCSIKGDQNSECYTGKNGNGAVRL